MPPTGREDVSVSSPPDVAVTAPAGSSSRDSAATRRLMPSRSISSSRPKECRILVRETPAWASHSLWASCRYRMTCPSLVLRDDAFRYTTWRPAGHRLGDRTIFPDQRSVTT